MTERRKMESNQPELSGLKGPGKARPRRQAKVSGPTRACRCGLEADAGHGRYCLPLCAVGAKRCTPSSFLTLAPPTGKLENTTVVNRTTQFSPLRTALDSLNGGLGFQDQPMTVQATAPLKLRSVGSRRD